MAESTQQKGGGSAASEPEYKDLGFGTRIGYDVKRLINKDGSFNVKRRGGGLGAIHPYQFLLSLTWWEFFLVVTAAFILVNSLFGLIYVLIGMEYLSGGPGDQAHWLDQFGYAFYFSVQTFSTVGYGATSPLGHATNLVASFESMVGLLGFALATGLTFGRFSKPSAKINFSKKAIVAPYHEINGFEFRIVNRRKNQLINLKVEVVLTCYQWNGERWKQEFYRLDLERNAVTLFPMSWTIVHPITEKSPLYGKTAEDLANMHAEFLIVMTGYDDTFAQTVYLLNSYRHDEVLWGARFVRNFYDGDDGEIIVEVDKVGKCERADLNVY